MPVNISLKPGPTWPRPICLAPCSTCLVARSTFVLSAAPAAPHDRATTTRHAGGIHNQRAFRVMARLLPCDWLRLPAYPPPWRQSTARRFFGDRTEPCPAAKIPPVERFRDRVAVVTGAASGIGLALTERFAAEGMKVVMADIEGPALASAAEALRRTAPALRATQVDVSRSEDVQRLAPGTVHAFGAAHYLCNNVRA